MSFAPVIFWWLLLPLAAVLMAGCLWLALTGVERIAWLRRTALTLLLLLTLLRPGVGTVDLSAASAQLDVIFVVDTTSSSMAEDYAKGKPRLDGMKADMLAIADKLPGAHLSLISFDQDAVVKLPLTSDRNAFDNAVDILSPEITLYSRGSSVTVAAKTLQSRLAAAQKSHPERARVVFYLGDGEQTASTPPAPFQPQQGLISAGAVLGYGTAAGGKMKENTGFGAAPGPGYIQDNSSDGHGDAISKIDENMLKQIAQQLGVPYQHRQAGDGVDSVTGSVAGAALKLDGSSGSRAQFELYWIFGLGVLALAGWELFDTLRQWRSIQPRRKKTTEQVGR
ncbi:Ca-activated chloride channel family protein [Psychromicrobium silvestre]|uniref:Ca-activated chloride channel family protein n=1 Tax=Psychromicrobium silvestre TaxID=1645614 RepID=A0A7Y9LRW4_9MICC|nr:VWA domain-containing protein [Psychromicrobium silvestre]NYE94466.1 Ca-activated chloride channel family protein [Psychromicrobium silvestre]